MSSKTQIKICGINNSKSAKACKGADFVGFVFYQKSPRFITAFKAKEISNYLEPRQKKVGLFVNSELTLIKHICDFANLDMIQLHGDEEIEDIKLIKKNLSIPLIKAIPINNLRDIEKSKKYQEVCDMILFDTKVKHKIYGGSGLSFDWNLLKNFKSKKKWMLAGGLNIDNVKNAIRITKAPIIDVSSGVEIKKGIKCDKKIKQIIKCLK